MTLYVYFSDNVGAPADKITVADEALYSKLQLENEAINNDAKYVHFYKQYYNEYDIPEYYYVTTKNAGAVKNG